MGSHPWGNRKILFLVYKNRSWCWHFWLLRLSLWWEQTSVFTLLLIQREWYGVNVMSQARKKTFILLSGMLETMKPGIGIVCLVLSWGYNTCKIFWEAKFWTFNFPTLFIFFLTNFRQQFQTLCWNIT